MPKKPTSTGAEMSTRAFSRAPSTVDVEARTFGIIASTETPVRRYVDDPRLPDRCILADEVLLLSGLDLSLAAGMPLVDAHNCYGIDNILGEVNDVKVEGDAVVATVELNSRNADLIGDIARGHYAQVSVGYDSDPSDCELVEAEGEKRSSDRPREEVGPSGDFPRCGRSRPECAYTQEAACRCARQEQETGDRHGTRRTHRCRGRRAEGR